MRCQVWIDLFLNIVCLSSLGVGHISKDQGICNPKILPDIKAEITKLIEAKFIRQCRYAEWISNVIPVYKKNGKLRVCIDFRNLNKATPMDGYPMLVADMLVDATT